MARRRSRCFSMSASWWCWIAARMRGSTSSDIIIKAVIPRWRRLVQTIKKYANRKLYHTNRKQYITLDGIAALIQAGDQVQVLDNETGEDITAQILSQVVL